MEVQRIDAFDFNSISLGEPQAIQGGSYYAKLYLSSDNIVCVQLPRCTLKQGIVETKKAKYCDLMYERSSSSSLVDWIEKLEVSIQDKIDNKKSIWFQGELTRDDIETMMTPISRSYKSGRKILIRCYLDISRETGKDKCIVYDEKETLLGINTLDIDRDLVPLIQIEGIRFTSRSFEVDIKLVQVMALDNRPDLSKVCLIKMNSDRGSGSVNASDSVNASHSVNACDSANASDIANTTNACNDCDSSLHTQDSENLDKETHNNIESEIEENIEDIKSESNDDKACLENKPTGESNIEIPINENPSVNEEEEFVSDGSVDTRKESNIPVIQEVNLDLSNVEDSISLKNPDEVYYNIYRKARKRAKEMRHAAVDAYLEAREIKNKYLLNDIDSSEEDEDIVDSEDGSTI